MIGIVKFFNDEKGWGFINTRSDSIFVHYTAIQSYRHRTLVQGEQVEFDIALGADGRKIATNVWRDPALEATTERPTRA